MRAFPLPGPAHALLLTTARRHALVWHKNGEPAMSSTRMPINAVRNFLSRSLSRRALARGLVGATAAVLIASASPVALAATPKDTLVLAWAIDDIITLDPAESFEISAGEIMGNTYDRLVRFDVAD